MTNRIPTFATAILLLLPFPGSTGLAEPVLDKAVAPVEVMNEIGRIVRREFFDPRALGAFNEAESRFKELAAGAAEVPRRWLRTMIRMFVHVRDRNTRLTQPVPVGPST